MVNVGTGNLLLQDDDMNVSHKGLALAFRRTYNSQSQHDVAGSDGATPGLYGNGWTNTFDAHLTGSSSGTITVWDIDGARYDYALAADGITRLPPPGQHATLTSDGGCGYLWTKKSGTTYYFWTPDGAAPCAGSWWNVYGAYAGRTYQIIGRNRNTYITFAYSWDNGNAAPTGKISAIAAQNESGLTANLSFADVSGHRLLQQILFPDGATAVYYGYDSLGNLTSVSLPPNNAAGTRLVQSFGFTTLGTGSLLQWAASPRWCASTCGTDGSFTAFGFAGTSVVTSTVSAIWPGGVINPVIPDGSGGGALQAGYSTSAYYYNQESYTTGVSTPTFRDTDGHATNWVVDALGRPIQTQSCTATANGTCTGTWLVTNQTWDASNNLATVTDPRNNETDYLHDLMGNTTAVGEPYTSTSQGSFKPTKIFDYDAFNNVVAYCDESEAHAANSDWSGTVGSIYNSDSLCASRVTGPHWRATYSYPSYEPYGELTTMTTPLGYTRSFSYAAAQQGGNDYGLPTTITGDPFTQFDGSSITPTQTFWYDSAGYLRCYSKGHGITVLSFDVLGRKTSVADPDDSSANASSVCGKSTGQPGWNVQTTFSYFPNGALQSSQTPEERAAGVATTFTYDADGNPVTESRHHGCTAGNSCTVGVTTKWYDGADRLVEVAVPHDPSDFYASTWLTRYLYDLSGGGSVAISGAGFRAYGNLFKTQEWVPAPGATSPSWVDLRGAAFDAMDRVVTKYSFSPSTNTTLRATTLTYDASTTSIGLLTSMTDPLNEMTTFAYDPAGKPTNVQFSGDGGVTPNKTFTYDANGRESTANSPGYGTEVTHYDADNRVVEVDEPQTGSFTSPAKITYDYYPNGEQRDVNVSSTALNATPLMSYAYRVDGERTKLHLSYGQRPGDFTWAYTDAGRTVSESDPYTGTIMPSPQPPVVAGSVYPPTTWTYDNYGQIAQEQLPEPLTYTLQHDDEGGVSAATGGNSANGLTINYALTVRGENLGATRQQPSRIANGAVVAQKIAPGGSGKGLQSAVIDPKNSVIASWGYESYSKYNDPNADPTSGLADCGPMTDSQDYDPAGRLMGHTLSGPGSSDPHCADIGSTLAVFHNYDYDAENHHINVTGVSASWNPAGHAYNLGGLSVHYDGELPLFGTDAQGNLYVKVETMADIDTTGQLTVWDRDYAGLLQSGHNSTLYNNVNLGNTIVQGGTISTIIMGSTNAQSCNSTGGTCVGSDRFLPYNRLEGFDFRGLTFQGARTVEASSGQWTTPDAYAGDQHDPLSQKQFMWDRNNPYDYADPSGFTPQQFAICDACGHGYMTVAVAKKKKPPGKKKPRMGGPAMRRANEIQRSLPRQSSGFQNGLEHEHYLEHRIETGAKTEAEYVQMAKDLFEHPNADVKTSVVLDPRDGNKIYMYDPRTGNVGRYDSDGAIRTFLNPDRKGQSSEEYFRRQGGIGVQTPNK